MFRRFLQYEAYLRYLAMMRLSSMMDAEDAVQATFVRAWLYCECLEKDDSISFWLARILVNECNNILRKRKRNPETYIGDDLLKYYAASGPGEDGIITRMDLHTALGALDDHYRIPIHMIFFYGLTSEETAAKLHKTRSAVSGMVRRGKEKLRAAM